MPRPGTRRPGDVRGGPRGEPQAEGPQCSGKSAGLPGISSTASQPLRKSLARQLSMSRSSVCNFLRLLELSEFVKEALLAERVSYGHARAMLSLKHEGQVALCQRIEPNRFPCGRPKQPCANRSKISRTRGQKRFLLRAPARRRSRPASVASNHVRSVEEHAAAALRQWPSRSSSAERKKARSSSPSRTTTSSSGFCDTSAARPSRVTERGQSAAPFDGPRESLESG